MANKKVYNSDEILKMAVGLIDPDIANADYNGDSKVTAEDARTRDRISSGLSVDTPIVGNSGIQGNTGSDNNIYAVSNAYQNQADAIYKRIQETPDFSYDFNEDAVFKALKEQYIKDGKLAAENVAGQAAALSGGYGNSYGNTAAGQAYMGAVDDLYENIPELQQAAYSRYQDKRNDELQNWEIMQNRADKERDYATEERSYQDSRDAYLWELALQRAEMGDYSALKEMGVDTSGREYETAFNKALSLAQVGDYSGLRALGVDVSTAQKQNELDFAITAAQYGDYSFLKALGIDTSAMEVPTYSYYSSGSKGGVVSEGEDDEGEDDVKKPVVVQNPFTGDIPDYNGDGKVRADDARQALRQSQGMELSYVQDELDEVITRLQAVIDDPNAGEGDKEAARIKLKKIKEKYYGIQ